MSREGFDGCIPINLVPIEKGVDLPVDDSRVASFYCGTYRDEVSKITIPPPKKMSEVENKNGDKSGSNRRGTKTPMTK